MPEGGGSGPDAVVGNTYSQIQREWAEQDLAIRRRKPGLDQAPILPTVPRNPANVWNDVDRKAPDRELDEDPSGTRVLP